MADFSERIIRAIKLEPELFEEVKNDEAALSQAMLVVLFSSLAAGAGAALHNPGMLLLEILSALGGWLIWAYLIYWIGTKWFSEPQTSATPSQLLRALGFATAPGMLRVFGIIPFLRLFVFLATAIWSLIAMVIAVKQVLNYNTTGRAVLVCIVAWIIQVAILAVLLALVFHGKIPHHPM